MKLRPGLLKVCKLDITSKTSLTLDHNENRRRPPFASINICGMFLLHCTKHRMEKMHMHTLSRGSVISQARKQLWWLRTHLYSIRLTICLHTDGCWDSGGVEAQEKARMGRECLFTTPFKILTAYYTYIALIYV